MKTIIAGSRVITDLSIVEQAIRESGFEITVVISGGAKGVDTLGEEWAKKNGIPIIRFLPDWQQFGKKAGILRNQEMADCAEACIVVHKGTVGSLDMIRKAKRQGIPTYDLDIRQERFDFDVPDRNS